MEARARSPSALEIATGMTGVGEHYMDMDSPTTPTTQSMQLRLRKQMSTASSSIANEETHGQKTITRVKKTGRRPEERGGLAYAAIMVIYASAPTVGGVVQQIWQIDLGVGLALLYNFGVFLWIPITQGNLISVPENLNDTPYFVSLHDWGLVSPFMLAFTFAIFLLPIKFAVMSNAFFSTLELDVFIWDGKAVFNMVCVLALLLSVLKFINPMNPQVGGTGLKDLNNSDYATLGLMKNLAVYSIIGVVGTLISLMTVLLPTPLL
ncbi:unnamed protein product [Phytophthora lilii]|uniref:Unnamed protein product n=1 Tax=Phytophthora lilii TaxID=2077276 RepID=A0A9W7D8N5_9STRA|nr:unnamed protein product [Phytophthora lilii]